MDFNDRCSRLPCFVLCTCNQQTQPIEIPIRNKLSWSINYGWLTGVDLPVPAQCVFEFFFCHGAIPVYEECDIVGYLYMRNVTQPRAKDATTKQTDTTETCVGKKMWTWTICELPIYRERKNLDKIILSPAAGQRRCSGAVQVSAPSAGGPPVTVERHKLKKEVAQTFTLLNIQTFTLSNIYTFTLSNTHTFRYSNFQTSTILICLIRSATCMMLNII